MVERQVGGISQGKSFLKNLINEDGTVMIISTYCDGFETLGVRNICVSFFKSQRLEQYCSTGF